MSRDEREGGAASEGLPTAEDVLERMLELTRAGEIRQARALRDELRRLIYEGEYSFNERRTLLRHYGLE